MKKLLNSALLLAFIASFAGCIKDNTTGPNGNADLTHLTYTIQKNQWQTRGTAGQAGYQYYTEISIPAITTDVIDHGAVMVYVLRTDLDMFYPLPAITTFAATQVNAAYVNTVQDNVYLGKIEIFIEDSDYNTVAPDPMTFKVVIFNSLKSLPAALDIRNYKQVESYIGK